MQPIAKPHNQHARNATFGAVHYLTNQHMQQRHVRQPIHYLFRIKHNSNECGVPTTCNESRLPHRDEGTQSYWRKRSDMMILCNCEITPSPILIDVTIGHTYSMQRDFKPNTQGKWDRETVENVQNFISDNI